MTVGGSGGESLVCKGVNQGSLAPVGGGEGVTR